MFIGTFDEGNTPMDQFPADVVAASNKFNASGVTNIIIDVTSNGGKCTFWNKC